MNRKKTADSPAHNPVDTDTPDAVKQIEYWDRAGRSILAALRRDEGYTQEQLAQKVGVKKQTLANMEAGRIPFKFGFLMYVCGKLGVGPSGLVTLIAAYRNRKH